MWLVLQASDSPSTGKVLRAIVQMCFDLQEWELLNEHILLLTKKRGQLKTVRNLFTISVSAVRMNLRYRCFLHRL